MSVYTLTLWVSLLFDLFTWAAVCGYRVVYRLHAGSDRSVVWKQGHTHAFAMWSMQPMKTLNKKYIQRALQIYSLENMEMLLRATLWCITFKAGFNFIPSILFVSFWCPVSSSSPCSSSYFLPPRWGGCFDEGYSDWRGVWGDEGCWWGCCSIDLAVKL